MSDLFHRECSLVVGARRITGLRMAFRVEKGIGRHPNKADISVYNLAEESRRALQNNTPTSVQLVAGYASNTEQLFLGDAREISHAKTGADWQTRLQAGDGERAVRKTRVEISARKGESVDNVISKIAAAMGVGLKAGVAAGGDVMNTFDKGLTLSGAAADELDKVCAASGREWSLQDGMLQVMAKGAIIGDDVVVLSPETGLIGSPLPGNKGTVKARSLIQQRLVPGRAVMLRATAVVGLHRVEKVTFTGDTHGQEWFADLELKAAA